MRAVVLDEADEMLDLGFRDDLESILDRTPSGSLATLTLCKFARNGPLRDGRARVCVATDVAARGIDLPDWDWSSMLTSPVIVRCSCIAAHAPDAPDGR